MESRQFDELLERVHAAIRDAEHVDAKGTELLKDLEIDIRDLIERSGVGEHGRSVNERLQEAIGHFEVSHPTLTRLLSEFSAILSNAGI